MHILEKKNKTKPHLLLVCVGGVIIEYKASEKRFL